VPHMYITTKFPCSSLVRLGSLCSIQHAPLQAHPRCRTPRLASVLAPLKASYLSLRSRRCQSPWWRSETDIRAKYPSGLLQVSRAPRLHPLACLVHVIADLNSREMSRDRRAPSSSRCRAQGPSILMLTERLIPCFRKEGMQDQVLTHRRTKMVTSHTPYGHLYTACSAVIGARGSARLPAPPKAE